jgi:hypothetical protein
MKKLKHKSKWSEEQVNKFVILWNVGIIKGEIQKRMNLSLDEVNELARNCRYRGYKLNSRKSCPQKISNRKAWAKDEVAHLLTLHVQKAPIHQMVKELNRSRCAIEKMLSNIRTKNKKFKPPLVSIKLGEGSGGGGSICNSVSHVFPILPKDIKDIEDRVNPPDKVIEELKEKHKSMPISSRSIETPLRERIIYYNLQISMKPWYVRLAHYISGCFE